MTEHADRFYVLTGGPGSGKSTLLDALEQRGYARTVEAGRGIIQDQMAISGRALPWHDPALFAELMLSWDMRSYRIAERSAGPVFFDRGVVDTIGFLELSGLPVPAYIEKAAETFRYHRRAFIAPPWKDIYQRDRERRQSFDEAMRTHEAIGAAYARHGYELIEVPRVSADNRAFFVLESVGLAAK